MNVKNYDFCGWVTRNDRECTDGRVIKRDAFAHQNGERVPLVWMHNHNDPELVLGHTILENRPDGVYGYSFLNNNPKANAARIGIEHGDYDSYSIMANHLQQSGKNVYHGDIKEVSLVLSGANPGAYIENIVLAHGDDQEILDDQAIIYSGERLMTNDSFEHADSATMQRTAEDHLNDLLEKATDEELEALALYVEAISDSEEYDDEEYDDQEYDDAEYDEEEEYDDSDDSDEDYDEEFEHSDYDDEGDEYMKTNIFDGGTQSNVLTHSDFLAIKEEAKRLGSFKDAYRAYVGDGDYMEHGDYDDGMEYATGTSTYGFNDPDMLFPDYKALSPTPEFIKRDDSWVSEFWGKVHRVPFQRIKSLYADITEDAARAKGYIKGNLKKEEVFKTMKRTTDATTIYKKQKLDKQDIDDITDFDVVAWIRAEMRVMLNEEIARAALIGDGRSAADEDKIDETKLRPVFSDSDFYVIRKTVAGGDPDTVSRNIIRGAVKARKDYKGSGNTTWFTTEDYLTDCLLLEDKMGHRLYKTESELASAMRVSKIVTVEVMEGLKDDQNRPVAGIIINPKDYTVGSNHGGKIDMFDDFDIDYNQYKYLLETRCSGCLTKYHSAIVLTVGDEEPSNPSQA